MKAKKMKRKNAIIPQVDTRLDPRYASARPWDWRYCRTCKSLIPNRCRCCGSDQLSDKPGHIIRAALAQFGPPPSRFKGEPMQNAPSNFPEVERILRENEQLHRRVGCLEAQNHRLAKELQRAALQLEWIATIVRERARPSGE